MTRSAGRTPVIRTPDVGNPQDNWWHPSLGKQLRIITQGENSEKMHSHTDKCRVRGKPGPAFQSESVPMSKGLTRAHTQITHFQLTDVPADRTFATQITVTLLLNKSSQQNQNFQQKSLPF